MQVYSSAPVNDGFWHMVTVTYDGILGNQKIYVDGIDESSGFANTSEPNLAVGSIKMGYNDNVTSSAYRNYYNGNMDDVGLWSRALTRGEVSQLYNNGSGKQYPF